VGRLAETTRGPKSPTFDRLDEGKFAVPPIDPKPSSSSTSAATRGSSIGASRVALSLRIPTVQRRAPYELRKVLNLDDDTLPRWVDFKRFVIEQAIKEINKLTDITITYDTIKKGRSVFEVVFNIKSKSETQKIISQRLIERTLDKKNKDNDDDTPY
ncbi:hypothetical protein ABZ578_39875, partial [Streptomyces sp. NPDC013489]